MDISDYEFTPTEREAMIDLLLRGDNLPAGIADEIDRHPKSVSRSLKSLAEKGLSREKNDYHVWTLTAGGRNIAMQLAASSETLTIQDYDYM